MHPFFFPLFNSVHSQESHPISSENMMEIFGQYEELPLTEEYLVIGFSPSSVPLKQRWRNNGLSADFLADYLVTFFPGSEDNPGSIERQKEIKGAVSYVANELLENAMKFNDEKIDYPISIRLQLKSDYVVFMITNSIPRERIAGFQDYIRELTTSDPGELYIQKIENHVEEENTTSSGLGLLTMVLDYMATLGWKFEQVNNEPTIMAVTTMVKISI